jgi:prepilin-type N-terminal cleavage/methylation domain-containing protein
MTTKQNKGFTLLEILLVIAAIGILAAIVLVAINPNRQIAQVRDAQRRSDINTIYKALEQYLIDTGSYPNSVNSNYKEICNTGTEQVGGATDCTNKADLRVLVPTFIAAIPTDTSGGVYRVGINPVNNRISIEATGSESGQSIVINKIIATGGDLIYDINVSGVTYRVHEFKTVGTFSFIAYTNLSVEYLIVGGGGGGGNQHGGGGGAGGLLTNVGGPLLTMEPSSYPVIVGNGAAINTVGGPGNDGGGSAFGAIIVAGGGGGGSNTGDANGRPGGSGGGAGTSTSFGGGSGGLGNQPPTTPSQGDNGGSASSTWPGGGGGGAGGVGQNSGPGPIGGNGGVGITSTITNTPISYAGGGGGAGNNIAGTATDGGTAGGTYFARTANAPANRGGGSGGTRFPSTVGAGGSGIVIVRYPLP